MEEIEESDYCIGEESAFSEWNGCPYTKLKQEMK